jgi:hypothetical protein
MASSINVNQNNNTVSLQDQNRKITITDNVQEKTVNVTQPVTNVVNVVTLGPTGPPGSSVGAFPFTGSAAISGTLSLDGPAGHITSSGNISASGTGSFGYMLLPNLPTSDPGVAGAVFRTGNDLKISTG